MIEINNIKKIYHQNYDIVIKQRKIEYIGEWRKDVAIGYRSHPINHHYVPLLISKNNEILYEGDSCPDYADEIYRTSKGHYIVIGYRDCSAPGKDPDYRGPIIKRIIDEDGKTDIHQCNIKYDSKTGRWYDPDDEKFFIPREMGMGIVENNGSFYRLENFEKLFDIPQIYNIESVFDKGLFMFSVPQDNRDYIVTVKNKEVINFIDVNDENKLFKLIEKTGDTSLINYCKRDDSSAINVFKKQQKIIAEQKSQEKQQRLDLVNYYSDYRFPRHYISKDSTTVEEFENGIKIDKDVLQILQELHRILSKEECEDEKEKISFHLMKNKVSPDNSLNCLFYSDFMILRMLGNYGTVLNRFYSLDGHPLSNKIYFNISTIKSGSSTKKCKNFNNHYFKYSNQKDSGIIIICGDKIVESPYPEFMYDTERRCYHLSVHESYISFENEYYDYFYKKIPVNYTDVRIDEIIKDYLYKMSPDFEVSMYADIFKCRQVNITLGGYIAEEKYMNGSIYLPLPSKLDSIKSELSYRIRNRPNHISDVTHIGNYKDDKEGDYSLYLFNCRPNGFCDTKGRIFYKFKPSEVVF